MFSIKLQSLWIEHKVVTHQDFHIWTAHLTGLQGVHTVSERFIPASLLHVFFSPLKHELSFPFVYAFNL